MVDMPSPATCVSSYTMLVDQLNIRVYWRGHFMYIYCVCGSHVNIVMPLCVFQNIRIITTSMEKLCLMRNVRRFIKFGISAQFRIQSVSINTPCFVNIIFNDRRNAETINIWDKKIVCILFFAYYIVYCINRELIGNKVSYPWLLCKIPFDSSSS